MDILMVKVLYIVMIKRVIYKGNFENGKKKGKGIQYYANGEKYEGEFDNDFKNGKGVFTFKAGRKFHGSFKDDCFEGKGVMIENGKSENVEYQNGLLKK